MLTTLLSPQPGGSGVTADLSATLAAVTLSSDATISSAAITGDLAATLGALTLASTAQSGDNPAIVVNLTTLRSFSERRRF